MNSYTESVEAIGSIATAIAVGLTWWQIREGRQQAVTSFEDSLAGEYREVAQRIPVAAVLGDQLTEAELHASLADFYHYVHMSSRQVQLRARGRIRSDTWRSWNGGIKANLEKPAFRAAWAVIKSRSPEVFGPLQRLEKAGFAVDPRDWPREHE